MLSIQQSIEYKERIEAMGDEDLRMECFDVIDAANQSPVYSVHDQKASMLCAEARGRGRLDIYRAAFTAAYRVRASEALHA